MREQVTSVLQKLHWLGHDTFRWDGPPVVYFDPWKLAVGAPKADLVLVSHDHFDHCSPEDVDNLRGPATAVVAAAGAAHKLRGALAIRAGQTLQAAGVQIEAVPAYNINKFRAPGQPFHPAGAGHVGFILTLDGVRLYFAGDTDFTPEMAQIRCDIALLPISGTYVMTIDEALQAAAAIGPAVVVPMHFGTIVGAEDDGAAFAARFEGQTAVLVKEP